MTVELLVKPPSESGRFEHYLTENSEKLTSETPRLT